MALSSDTRVCHYTSVFRRNSRGFCPSTGIFLAKVTAIWLTLSIQKLRSLEVKLSAGVSHPHLHTRTKDCQWPRSSLENKSSFKSSSWIYHLIHHTWVPLLLEGWLLHTSPPAAPGLLKASQSPDSDSWFLVTALSVILFSWGIKKSVLINN